VALKPKQIAETRRCLDQISQGWDDAIERLKMLVETA